MMRDRELLGVISLPPPSQRPWSILEATLTDDDPPSPGQKQPS